VSDRGALAGIRIVDFSHVYQGPVGTQLLADFGADVIKVERPGGGDWSRSWGPYVEGVSMPFASLNRNKRSIAIDLRSDAGRAAILRLVLSADVLVHNFRPGVMERLGLGYDDLRASHPRLVYARSSGWGDEGPYVDRGRGGHDMLARAEAGWFERIGPGGAPLPSGISADYPAGLLLMEGILIALLARERTGEGQLVSTDLLSAAFHAHSWDGGAVLNADRTNGSGGIGVTEKVILKCFRTADRYIEISPVFSADFLRDISLALGLADLSLEPRFTGDENRLANAAEINAILQARFAEKTTQEWIAILEPKGILCGEVNTLEEAARDPQIAANHMVVEMEHARAGTLRLFGTPVRLYGTPATLRLAPPDLGADNEEVLADLGYSQDEIAALKQQGVLG
jgi:crotonobetainyl-CoA:carnitine CoA-transferase CaiB-like acyl-CoA transferase